MKQCSVDKRILEEEVWKGRCIWCQADLSCGGDGILLLRVPVEQRSTLGLHITCQLKRMPGSNHTFFWIDILGLSIRNDASKQICVVTESKKLKFKFQESLERLSGQKTRYWPFQLIRKPSETSFKNSLGTFLSLIRLLRLQRLENIRFIL